MVLRILRQHRELGSCLLVEDGSCLTRRLTGHASNDHALDHCWLTTARSGYRALDHSWMTTRTDYHALHHSWPPTDYRALDHCSWRLTAQRRALHDRLIVAMGLLHDRSITRHIIDHGSHRDRLHCHSLDHFD